ncbi:MAG: alpha/beta hydrolase [Deltaproteobacteria bacterium]|nr:alpha/beta hydrolase [Deltaproteobacteria bacterium]
MSLELPRPQSFVHHGRRVAFREYGSGARPIVLTHGLLMDGTMFAQLGPALAQSGHRVLTVDMPGHGSSAQPHDMHAYSMTHFGRDVLALLDHLELPQAVVGGTSLGANVALEVAVAHPERVRALVLEMPVLEHGLAGAAALFVPLALALRVGGQGVMRAVSSVARRVPRFHFMADLLLDFIRRDPAASLAVLDGVTFGRVAPPREDRLRLQHPALIVGHPSDPIHPFSDAEMLADELPNARLVLANSILEWRLRPGRLDAELRNFLDSVWSTPLRPS